MENRCDVIDIRSTGMMMISVPFLVWNITRLSRRGPTAYNLFSTAPFLVPTCCISLSDRTGEVIHTLACAIWTTILKSTVLFSTVFTTLVPGFSKWVLQMSFNLRLNSELWTNFGGIVNSSSTIAKGLSSLFTRYVPVETTPYGPPFEALRVSVRHLLLWHNTSFI